MSAAVRAQIHKPFTLDLPTGLSLGLAFSLLPAAQLAARSFLGLSTTRRYKFLFIWLFYDFLTHTIIEGSFLYHCFFSWSGVVVTGDYPHPASIGRAGEAAFLGRLDRNYGSLYSEAPMAKLWQEYAKADARWAGSDLTVVSIELLTVLLAGPVAIYCCYLLARITNAATSAGSQALAREKGDLEARFWFLIMALSVAELYGGWMTFCPEWLSGNMALAGLDEPVFLWLYLAFFNGIWVVVPFLILIEGWKEMRKTWARAATHDITAKKR